jgi:hypothetical protein
MGAVLRGQFANPRARLLPGFAAPHLTVAGAIVGGAVAIQALLLPAWSGAGGLLVLLALSLSAIAISAWSEYSTSSTGTSLSFLIVALMLANAFERQYVVGLVQTLLDRPMICLVIALAGLAGLAALGWRLVAIHEGMPEYSREAPPRWDFRWGSDIHEWRRWDARSMSRSASRRWLSDLEFRLVLQCRAPGGWLRRLLLRQLAGRFGGLSAMVGVFAFMLFSIWFYPRLQEPFDPESMAFLLYFPLLLAVIMLGGGWLRRWPYLAWESLLPVGRRDFVRDMARTMACDVAATAAAQCGAMVIWRGLLASQELPHGLLVRWVTLTIVAYVLAYCLLFWLITFRRLLVLFLGILVAFGVAPALMRAALVADESLWSPVSLVLAILATSLVAALLYALAFRRWCRIDLD